MEHTQIVADSTDLVKDITDTVRWSSLSHKCIERHRVQNSRRKIIVDKMPMTEKTSLNSKQCYSFTVLFKITWSTFFHQRKVSFISQLFCKASNHTVGLLEFTFTQYIWHSLFSRSLRRTDNKSVQYFKCNTKYSTKKNVVPCIVFSAFTRNNLTASMRSTYDQRRQLNTLWNVMTGSGWMRIIVRQDL